MKRAATARLRPAALVHNLGIARRAAPRSRILAVIKAEAYGHGLLRVADALAPHTDGFAVSCLEEAFALRNAGHTLPLLVLQGFRDAQELVHAARQGITVAVHDPVQLRLLETTPLPRPVRVWLKLDSGMGRLGFPAEEAFARLRALRACPNVAGPPVLMTHLACADEPGRAENAAQLARFEAATRDLPGGRSLANSAAILGLPRAHGDWNRPGILLYGASPLADGDARRHGLQPVMTLQAPLVAVHDLVPGDAVGYGATFRCRRPTRVGVVAIGYADGYPRHVPSGVPVCLPQGRAPLIGRVSMDLITIDLTDLPGAAVGDPVTLWGEGLPVEEVARAAETISYDLLCAVAGRVRVEEVPGPAH
ncbi:alanine racemase [Ectothiorhodospira mobilis]|uniref:alanine racemase n=1 Tax=Ectothiorhodospira mobilis TaxID=195064 RepID=UPI0019077C50|nr:alanine racemase [Ectothiorhodospira mobilis]